MQPFANQSTLFVLPVLQIQHGLSTQILLRTVPCRVLLHVLQMHQKSQSCYSHTPPSLSSASLISFLSCRDRSSLGLFLEYKELFFVFAAVWRRRWEYFQEGKFLHQHCQSNARSLSVPTSLPCLDTATRLLSGEPSWAQHRQLNSGELAEQNRGPPGKVSPTPLATSSLGSVCSVRANSVWTSKRHKTTSCRKPWSLLPFPWIKEAYSVKKQHRQCKKGVGDEVMGMGQGRTGAQLSLQAAAAHQQGSATWKRAFRLPWWTGSLL